jgi:hypothetical protein
MEMVVVVVQRAKQQRNVGGSAGALKLWLKVEAL